MTDTFSQYSQTVDYYSRWRKAECALSSAQVIADIGSGTGQLTDLLLQNDNPVYAVEPNLAQYPAMVAEQKAICDHHQIGGSFVLRFAPRSAGA